MMLPFRVIDAAMSANLFRYSSNFLTQVKWRLYKIRQPPTCLCTTLHTNTAIETFRSFGETFGNTGAKDKSDREDRQDKTIPTFVTE